MSGVERDRILTPSFEPNKAFMEEPISQNSNAPKRTSVTRVTRSDMGRLGAALFGGILVLDSYLAGLFFGGKIDQFTMDLFALIGAVILSVPIFW